MTPLHILIDLLSEQLKGCADGTVALGLSLNIVSTQRRGSQLLPFFWHHLSVSHHVTLVPYHQEEDAEGFHFLQNLLMPCSVGDTKQQKASHQVLIVGANH